MLVLPRINALVRSSSISFSHYGANSIPPVNNKIAAIMENIKRDEERIKDIIGMTFFSVFFAIPNIENRIPMPVRNNAI